MTESRFEWPVRYQTVRWKLHPTSTQHVDFGFRSTFVLISTCFSLSMWISWGDWSIGHCQSSHVGIIFFTFFCSRQVAASRVLRFYDWKETACRLLLIRNLRWEDCCIPSATRPECPHPLRTATKVAALRTTWSPSPNSLSIWSNRWTASVPLSCIITFQSWTFRNLFSIPSNTLIPHHQRHRIWSTYRRMSYKRQAEFVLRWFPSPTRCEHEPIGHDAGASWVLLLFKKAEMAAVQVTSVG